MELQNDTTGCLDRHSQITHCLRARMIDWMIEVLTNFKCDDQTFFLAVSLMDRYFKGCIDIKQIGDLHVTGVTTMFVASKFEDIYPLKMKTVYEKIAHQKIEMQTIKTLELDIMKVIQYKIHAPTVLDFLKVFLIQVLKIEICNRTETKKKEEFALKCNGKGDKGKSPEVSESSSETFVPTPEDHAKVQDYLIEKMAIYLAKMSMHDEYLSCKRPSLLAVGSIYVALKICE